MFSLSKYALNHGIERAVLTERQTSDCEVTCRITFSFQKMFIVYRPQFGWKTSVFVKVTQNSMVYILYSFYATTVIRNEPQSTMGDTYKIMQFTRIFLIRTQVIVKACCARYKTEFVKTCFTKPCTDSIENNF